MDTQPENVVAFQLPMRTTLPYPIKAICDELPVRQDDDFGDTFQFTIIDHLLNQRPSFNIPHRELSPSTFALKFITTYLAFAMGEIRAFKADAQPPRESMPETVEA